MDTILVTGGTGLVGSAVRIFRKCEYIDSSVNLTNMNETIKLFERIKPNIVIHLAGKVGGVKANTNYVAQFYTDNILINTNVLHASHLFGVEKVVSLMSTCIFPDKVKYPITEDQLHNGNPHESNFGYAHAKRMLDVQSRAYRQQYGSNFVTLIPNNIYGPNDNFHLQNGHVIPALIRKIYEAGQAGEDVILWGDGEALRQFTYSLDIGDVIFWAVDNYNEPEPLNIGNPEEYSIKKIAETIADKFAFDGDIIWDRSQPSGQFRKTTSTEKFRQTSYPDTWTSIELGLHLTCDWFKRVYPNIRTK